MVLSAGIQAMYQRNQSGNLAYSNAWYPNYHPNQHGGMPFIPESDQSQVHYHPMFHPASDWAGYENFSAANGALLQPGHPAIGHSTTLQPQMSNGLSHSDPNIPQAITSLPSPPITVSGSEISSPGGQHGEHSPSHGNRPPTSKTPYEWMKKSSYQNQPNPGKTRTKDKYRVVYTDYQRLELEKEYLSSRYITIRRKTELAQVLQLSERQVKIWFQNRRAKERKQTKKRDVDGNQMTHSHVHPHPLSHQLPHCSMASIGSNSVVQNLLDVKPKIDHIQSSLHHMSSMGMGIPQMQVINGHHPLRAEY